MEQAAPGKFFLEPSNQRLGQSSFLRADRREIPLLPIHVVDGDERWLATHGEPDVVLRQFHIDAVPQGADLRPLLIGIGPAGAGRFINPRHLHFMRQLCLALLDRPGDGRGAGRIRRTSQRNVAFTSQKPGSGIQANPTRPGQINFRPGMQVGEIALRPRGAVQRL